jgi:hypothetical protein
MRYLKRLPFYVSAIGGIGLGIYYLYENRPFSFAYRNLVLALIIFYWMGMILRNTLIKTYNDYVRSEKYGEKSSRKEGNDSSSENNAYRGMDKK